MNAIHDPLTPAVVIERVGVVVRRILRPAMLPEREPLRLSVMKIDERLPYAKAAAAKSYRTVTTPYRWGPQWSTAWLRVGGRVPRHWSGKAVVLHVDFNGEALIWRGGLPYHGVSPYHTRIPLLDRCRGGESINLMVEAAANHLFGQLRDVPTDMQSEPALLSTLEMAVMDPMVVAFCVDLNFAADLLNVSRDLLNPAREWGGFTPPMLSSPETRRLAGALDAVLNGLREHDLAGTLPIAHRRLRDALRVAPTASRTTSCVTGHSHIDVAWLWPLAETRRKCSRTFSTMLRHMERDPDFVYLQSQAQLYAYVEQDYPALMRQIDQRVREGRWEAGGGMWVEADCNLASGESLIRQLLHGIRFWRHRFGAQYRSRYLWLPDVFGYTAALPQILKHCGLDTFFTQKISWNETNRFPHTTFWWRGIDGSSVLSHFFPTDNYNGTAMPHEIVRGDFNNQQSDLIPFWLNPVGHGDGGGGPTAEILQRIKTAAQAPLLPRVRYQLPGAFSDDLHRAAQNCSLPVWQGELYLELHRGTLTTQAQLKQCNRLAELALRETELWSYLAWGGSSGYPASGLDRLWKSVLLQQFHDVLPGSSISAVNQDSRRDYAALLLELTQQRAVALARLTSGLPVPAGMREPYAVFNAAEHSRDGVVMLPSPPRRARGSTTSAPRLTYVSKVPGLGAKVFDAAATGLPAGVEPVKATARTLDNGVIRVVLDAAGRVRSLIRKTDGREAVAEGQPLNQFVLYSDRPNQWDAWDINRHYLNMGDAITTRATMQLIEKGPLRAIIEVRRPLGVASQMVQHIRLDAAASRLDFVTWIRWGEEHRLLRVLHPVDVLSDFATYEIQFGYVRRATHCNTSWDGARFESCAHTWMDLSENGFGLALLNDAKYGHSCLGNVMGLSLLRSPRQPDEKTDIGDHEFTYSLMPHGGDPIGGGVPAEARALNQPLHVEPVAKAASRNANAKISDAGALHPFVVPAGIRVECFKKAEDSAKLVVRFVEVAGSRRMALIQWRIPIKSILAVDALEQPTNLFKAWLDRKKNIVKIPFGAFSIRTLLVELKSH